MQEIEYSEDYLIKDTEEQMTAACEHMQREFTKLRAGRATTQILDDVRVEYYGAMTPVNQIATIATPDARTLVIKPWDKKMISVIEKAILVAKIDIPPQNNGESIILAIPQLTEERRTQIVKQAKTEAEKARVSVRNIRKGSKDIIKKMEKEGFSEDSLKKIEEKLQSVTDEYIKKIDSLLDIKEKDIMTL